MEDPSKPIPSSNAPLSSLGVMENDFKNPIMSVNQRRIEETPCSSTYLRTSSGVLSDNPLRDPISSTYSSISSRNASTSYSMESRLMGAAPSGVGGEGVCGKPDTIPLKKKTKPVGTLAISLAE